MHIFVVSFTAITSLFIFHVYLFFRVSSAKSSIASHGLIGTAEKSFLTPNQNDTTEENVPSLDEFDTEIDIYRVCSPHF